MILFYTFLLFQIVDIAHIRTTTIGQTGSGILFAHSEYNHPVPGITVGIQRNLKIKTMLCQNFVFYSILSKKVATKSPFPQ